MATTKPIVRDGTYVVEVSGEELGLLLSSIRANLRKAQKSRRQMQARFGDELDPTAIDGRIARADTLYRKLRTVTKQAGLPVFDDEDDQP